MEIEGGRERGRDDDDLIKIIMDAGGPLEVTKVTTTQRKIISTTP